MDDHSEPRWRIGQVSARTGLTTRTLRYYEELGLLRPSGRLVSGHRVYASEDLRRLYRISLLRQLGLPLSDIAEELRNPSRDLSDTIGRHVGQVDQRMAALGRHRERMITIRDFLAAGSPTDVELLDTLHDMAEIDHGLTQRLTLLVYDDIEAVHDHLVAVFGFGPGTITRDECGRVVHGELHVGDGVVWMHPPSADYQLASPASLGASTHCMAVMVDDVDQHHERSVAAGATVVYPPRDIAYGVREYAARDLEGGLWSFMTPINPEGRSDMSELTPYICVGDSRAAIDWYGEVFGAAVQGKPYVMDDGRVDHVELRIGDALLMMADPFPEVDVEPPDPSSGSAVSLISTWPTATRWPRRQSGMVPAWTAGLTPPATADPRHFAIRSGIVGWSTPEGSRGHCMFCQTA